MLRRCREQEHDQAGGGEPYPIWTWKPWLPGSAASQRGATTGRVAVLTSVRCVSRPWAGPVVQPLRVRPGVIQAEFGPRRERLGEHPAGGLAKSAWPQADGASRLEPQGPPRTAAGVALGELDRAARAACSLPRRSRVPARGEREPAADPVLADSDPACGRSASGVRKIAGERPFAPGFQTAADGQAGDHGVPQAGLHVQGAAVAQLHREPARPGGGADRCPPVVRFRPGHARTIPASPSSAGRELSSAPPGCPLPR
jgi:hypothetical protein